MKKVISVIISAAIIASAVSAYAADSAVTSLQNQGIMSGDEKGELNLKDTVTRAEFCKMAVEAFNLEEGDSKADFADVNLSHWAYKYINIAYANGVINGFGDGNFRPEDSVTYEQAIKITLNSAGVHCWKGMEFPAGYIQNAIDLCILDGVTAAIGENITREDAANLIYNVQQYQTSQKNEEKGKINAFFSASTSQGGATGSIAAPMGDAANAAVAKQPDLSESVTIADSEAPMMAYGASGGGGGMYVNPYFNTEEYTKDEPNVFKDTALSPLSTFSIDTDTASYSNMRRFIVNGQVPPIGSIRSEELINYFDYDLPEPENGEPFSVSAEVSKCPWNSEHQLAMLSVKGEEIAERKPQNLVLLIDVSGSMSSANKLPLVKRSMKLLLDRLDERDTISAVTYASGTHLVLDCVNASKKDEITEKLDSLYAGGATNGAGGLEMAYEQAEKGKIDGNNRIILCTDGDFNVGPSSTAELEDLVTKKRDSGIFISVLGFGMDNYKDNRMEIMADKGNGSYYYIDSMREAKKVFVDEMTKTLYTIAKDVKIQVEFNPTKVSGYRLVGYENRLLNTEDFADDTKDAGELGSGASVTAFYEIIPADENAEASGDGLRYQTAEYKDIDEMFCVSLRYKEPDGNESKLIEKPVSEISKISSDNFRMAAAAAELGMILNDSEYKGSSTYDSVTELARSARGSDEFGIRTEFIQLVDLLRYIDTSRRF